MGHEYQDEISLEFARRIAAGLHDHLEWLDLARANLDLWSERNHDAPGLLRCYSEWQEILRRPLVEVCALMTSKTDEGQRLRQNSPFAGVLSPQDVWGIKRRLRRHEPTTT